MECKECLRKSPSYGFTKTKCSICDLEVFIQSGSTDICEDCSIRLNVCMTCGCQIPKQDVNYVK